MRYKPLLVKMMATAVLLLIAISFTEHVLAQTAKAPVTITGKIVDEQTGETLPGVTVKVKNTTRMTSTNLAGVYSIAINNPQEVLVFTFVGYEPQERAAGSLKTINISLKPTASNLNEVVVVGYGTQKKQFLTGSVARANLEAFHDAPDANFVQMLQGTVVGLNIGQVNVAGQTPAIQVRGASTLNGNTTVLIILDGIQYNGDLQSINPDDIATIDVLKDASATAVYGAQAANGVILITTKKGKQGKTRVTASSSYATQTPTQNLKPLDPDAYQEHVRMLYYQQAYLAPDYTTPDPTFNLNLHLDAASRANAAAGNSYDWWGNSTHLGHMYDNKVSISGGTDQINYLMSYNNTNQQGFIVNDLFKRQSVRVNLETKIAPWWTAGVQSFATFVNKDGAEPTLADIIRFSPFVVPFNASGDLLQNPDNTVGLNPFLSQYVDDIERNDYFFANFYTDIKFPFMKGLSYRINYGNNYRDTKQYRSSKYAQNGLGEAYKNNTFYNDYTLDNILTYQRDFGKHSIETTLLYGSIERKNQNTNADARQFTQLTLGYDGIQQGAIQLVSSSAYKEALAYQMGRVNYKYDNKYLLTGTVRRDGFSGFAQNNKWGIFPSLSAGWIVTNEKFLKLPWLNYLKLRGGYGISGNQTNRYASLSTVSSSAAYVFGDVSTPAFGQQQTAIGNSNLRWEKTTGKSLGIDFEVLHSRLTGSVDMYDNITTDLLYNVAIPYATGYSIIATNIGKLQNRGLEISLTSKNISSKDFDWTSTVNFSTNSNKILSLLGQDNNHDGVEDDLIASNLFINRSIGTVYGYQTAGIYQLADKDIRTGYFPGNYRIVDQNGDNLITPTDDRVVLGRTEPAYRVSLLNTLRYSNFTLTFFLNSIQGGKNGYLGASSVPLVLNDNTVRWNYLSALNYWQPNNPGGTQPFSVTAPAIAPTIYSDRSFVRLQDVTLSYRVPKKLTDKLHLQNLSVFASGKNLATWTKWKGWDPETNQALIPDGRPVLKGASFGLNVSF
ncbi:TonB-dependent receptor [Mucilaginibacter mali]|uniref:TonB-dependent receptor n=1 Tax=Mucilaginibacter mali TaxID=2740462 RepID=A0A7D4UMX7_9SPHI|nr:TonB-dependent receptor [Mucilaginibacter mali]QKJ28560.1 TonB-dependent receptor [Mucilaginibacter mali]